MPSFEIVTDSCCNLPEEVIEEFGLTVIPMTFMVDNQQFLGYQKGVKTDLKQFYTMMREGKVITTSLPNMVDAEATLRSIVEAGKDLIYVGFSSTLSATFESIEHILKQLSEEYPERTVLAVDTLAASGGVGLLTWYAATMRNNGSNILEIYDWLEGHKLNLAHWFTVDDLMFLFRGGRVSRTSAWAGSLLNIKPVMHVTEQGVLVPIAKVRGRRKSLNAIVKHFAESAIQPVEDQMIFVMHGDCLEDAEYVAGILKKSYGVKKLLINYIDPVIGAHSGPGTMAIFFLAHQR